MSSILQVIEAASTQDLTTIASAKLELGLTTTTQQEDNQILAHIRQASSQISGYCNRVFGLETVQETFLSTVFNRSLVLRRRPVVIINSIVSDLSEIDPSEYFVDSERGIVYRQSTFFISTMSNWSTGNVVVNYDAGYDLLDGVPHAIERACLTLVKKYYNAISVNPDLRSEDIPGVASYSYGNIAGERGGELPSEVAALLNPFRDFGVA